MNKDVELTALPAGPSVKTLLAFGKVLTSCEIFFLIKRKPKQAPNCYLFSKLMTQEYS